MKPGYKGPHKICFTAVNFDYYNNGPKLFFLKRLKRTFSQAFCRPVQCRPLNTVMFEHKSVSNRAQCVQSLTLLKNMYSPMSSNSTKSLPLEMSQRRPKPRLILPHNCVNALKTSCKRWKFQRGWALSQKQAQLRISSRNIFGRRSPQLTERWLWLFDHYYN